MNWEIENKNRIQILKRMGLNKTDSLVYFVLMKFGPDGTFVYNLIHKLQNKIKRTTLYSILKKLSDLGESQGSSRSRRLTQRGSGTRLRTRRPPQPSRPGSPPPDPHRARS